jgi:hypothetical protein
MTKRKFFVIFLTVMVLTIIVMMIVWGVFLKDVNLNVNIKNPSEAPTPTGVFDSPTGLLDNNNQDDEAGILDERGQAKVNVPGKSLPDSSKEAKEESLIEKPGQKSQEEENDKPPAPKKPVKPLPTKEENSTPAEEGDPLAPPAPEE